MTCVFDRIHPRLVHCGEIERGVLVARPWAPRFDCSRECLRIVARSIQPQEPGRLRWVEMRIELQDRDFGALRGISGLVVGNYGCASPTGYDIGLDVPDECVLGAAGW